MEVPFISKDDIENSVVNLLYRFGGSSTAVNAPPVPVEEICEQQLGLDIVTGDLAHDFPEKNFGDAIGALDVDEQSVFVDEKENRIEGRLRFTVSHEIGHYELHLPYLWRDPNQGLLFPDNASRLIVCRRRDENLRREWQANRFASALLMPKPLIIPFIMTHKRVYRIDRIRDPFNRFPCYLDELLWELRNKFKVSGTAAIIRLKDLGIVEPSTRQAA